MADDQAPPTDTKGGKPKNKKIMYGILGLAAVVLIYVYEKNKSASAATTANNLVTGGAIDPLTGAPYQAGVGSLAQSTGAGIQGMGTPIIIKNIMRSSKGGSGAGSTTVQPTPWLPGGANPGGANIIFLPARSQATSSAQQKAAYAAATNMAVANTSNAALVANKNILFNSSGQATNVGYGSGRSATTGQFAFTGYPFTGPNAVPYATQKAYGWVN